MKALTLVAFVCLAACGQDFLDQDTDSDGLINSVDLCPTVAENPNEYKDEDGCPDDGAPPEPLDLSVSGSWYGVLEVQRENRDPLYLGSATTPTSGAVGAVLYMRDHDALVYLPCGWGTAQPSVHGVGTGRRIAFDAATVCPEGGPPACREHIEYHGGTVTWDGAGEPLLVAHGAYVTCDGSLPATMTMRGTMRR